MTKLFVLEGTFADNLAQLLLKCVQIQIYIRSHKALCSFVMNISKDGQSLTSLDSLFQCFIMFIMDILLLIFHQNSFCCSMCLLSLTLLLWTFQKSLALSSVQSPTSWLQRAIKCLLSSLQAEQDQVSPSSSIKCSPAPDHIAGSSLDSLHVFPTHWAAQTRHIAPDAVPQVD